MATDTLKLKAQPGGGLFVVKDMNCKPGQVRTHTMEFNGEYRDFDLTRDGVPVPEDFARKFAAADKAFKVMSPTGEEIRPKIAESDTGNFILEEGQCVAYFEELTLDALLERAHGFVEGQKLSKRDGKKGLVEFLTGISAQDPVKARPADDDESVSEKAAKAAQDAKDKPFEGMSDADFDED